MVTVMVVMRFLHLSKLIKNVHLKSLTFTVCN